MFNSVVKLTGLSDEKEIKALTEEILGHLRQRKKELAIETHQGVFVYKVILIHVFSYLEAQGNTQRIAFLQKILLIHPSHYKNPLPGTSQQGEPDT